MGLIRGVVFLILLIIGVGFAIQNDQPVCQLKAESRIFSPPADDFRNVFLRRHFLSHFGVRGNPPTRQKPL